MTRSMPNGARVRNVALRLLAAAAGAIACVALVGWTLGRNSGHDSALLGVNAALSSILISWMVWKFTRKGEACVRAETALRASEEQLRLFTEGVLEYAFVGLDHRGRVVSWNTGAERIIGYKPAEIIGRSVLEFYVLEDVAAGMPAMELKRAAELGKWEDEGWRVRADGTHFWAHVLITALMDDAGNLRGFSSLTRDISVGERAEQAAALVTAAGQRAFVSSAHFSRIAGQA
jgi:PAS domain S-box-containing protein